MWKNGNKEEMIMVGERSSEKREDKKNYAKVRVNKKGARM